MKEKLDIDVQMFIDLVEALPDNSIWNILYSYNPEEFETLQDYLSVNPGYRDQSIGEPDFCIVIHNGSRERIVDLLKENKLVVCHQTITFNNNELFVSYDHLTCNWVSKLIFDKMNNAEQYLKDQVFEMMHE